MRLTPEWQDFLKLAQDEGAEDLADERQRERHRRERERFEGKRDGDVSADQGLLNRAGR